MDRQKYRKICKTLGYAERDEQYHLIRGVLENLSAGNSNPTEKSLAIYESPTGTGKSLAYLVAACEFIQKTGEKVAITSATRDLQIQILNEFNSISNIYPGIRIALLQGQSNYISPVRLDLTLQKFQNNDKVSKLLVELKSIADREDINGNIILIDSKTDIFKRLKNALRDQDESDLMNYLACPQAESVAYTTKRGKKAKKINLHLGYYAKAKEKAANADIVVTNHHMLVKSRVALPPHVIIDEAHNLIDVAVTAWGNSVAFSFVGYAVKMVANSISNSKFEEEKKRLFAISKAIYNAIKQLIEVGKLDSRDHILLNDNEADPVAAQAMKTIQEVHDLASEAMEIIEKQKFAKESGVYTEPFEYVYAKLKDVSDVVCKTVKKKGDKDDKENKEAKRICYLLNFSPVEKYPSIHYIFPFSSRKLQYVFFEKKYTGSIGVKSITMLSGTLRDISSPLHEFDRLMKQAGLYDHFKTRNVMKKVFNGFNYRDKICVQYYKDIEPYDFDDDLSSKENTERHVRNIVDTVKGIVRNASHSVLVLTSSHYETQKIREVLNGDNSINKTIMTFTPYEAWQTGTLPVVKERFDSTPGAILISASTWEGFNPETQLSDLVITKLPWENPNNPIAIAQAYTLQKLIGEEKTRTVMLNNAWYKTVIKTLQGIGRIGRNENSTGTIHILDSRILKENGKYSMLRSILRTKYGEKIVEKDYVTEQIGKIRIRKKV